MSESVAEGPSISEKKREPLVNSTASETRGNGLFIWAIAGVVLLLSQAMFRLSQIAWEAISSGTMSQSQIAICIAWSLSNIYLEGYRGFHKRFVPRVIARAHYLATQPRPHTVLFAPLFAMAFFHSNRRAKGAAWGVTIAVMLAIVLVRTLAQPWRGIIDAGVVTGLGFGTLSLLIGASARLLGKDPTNSPDLPA